MGRKPFGKTKKNNICVSVDPEICSLAEMMISLKMAPSQGWFYEECVRQLQARYSVDELDRQISIAKEDFEARLKGYEELRSIARENAARQDKLKQKAAENLGKIIETYRDRKKKFFKSVDYERVQKAFLECRVPEIQVINPDIRSVDLAFEWMEEQTKEDSP